MLYPISKNKIVTLFVFLLLIISCKKKDKEKENTTTNPTTETAPPAVTQPAGFTNTAALAVFNQLNATELLPRTLSARTNVHFIVDLTNRWEPTYAYKPIKPYGYRYTPILA